MLMLHQLDAVSDLRVQPLRYADGCLHLLDQRVLPHATAHVVCPDAVAVAAAIRAMVVRGAPAIAQAAAYGVVMAAAHGEDLDTAIAALAASRPTAVNLRWALERMQRCIDADGDLLAEAEAMQAEDLAANLAIGAAGAKLLTPGCGVWTHCNTGALATAGHGTALGIVRSAHAAGRLDRVYVGETRPWLQGARLTAWELQQEGIPAELAVDSAAAHLMAQGRITWVLVGADRIAANGDTANKIGTYGLAVLARHHGVGFLVAAHTATIDPRLPDGGAIPIEQRPASEVTSLAGQPIAPSGCAAINPAFDVTPHELITALVSERGVIQRPDAAQLAAWIRP